MLSGIHASMRKFVTDRTARNEAAGTEVRAILNTKHMSLMEVMDNQHRVVLDNFDSCNTRLDSLDAHCNAMIAQNNAAKADINTFRAELSTAKAEAEEKYRLAKAGCGDEHKKLTMNVGTTLQGLWADIDGDVRRIEKGIEEGEAAMKSLISTALAIDGGQEGGGEGVGGQGGRRGG
jgi:hypothetical protein